MKRTLCTLGLAGCLLGLCLPAAGESASVLLERGKYTEQTVGDLVAAIQIYKKVLSGPNGTEVIRAEAQFRLGMCHFKQKQLAAATAAFKAVVANYPKQKQLVAEAQKRLVRLVDPDPAALMPPDTQLYIEMGSPGRQVEKVLEMLKGTPLADPLAVMGKGEKPTSQPSRREAKSPLAVLASVLNPSMIKEFKKVRGLAVGITQIQKDKPPKGIGVLYAGESDALRGLLIAGLSGVSQPAGQEDGMELLSLPQGYVCAYDDNVFIFASSRDLLTRSIKQHKGITTEPSLSTSNKYFASMISKTDRREDVITVWADPASIFTTWQNGLEANIKQWGAAARHLREMRKADAIVDFVGIRGAAGRFSLGKDNIFMAASAAFDPKHQCLPYSLVRTPKLSKAGFEAVPSNVVGLMAFALNDAYNRPSDGARQAVKSLTGLDIGREIFANIEQITIFAIPAKEGIVSEAAERETVVFGRFGLVITSRNVAKTRVLLDKILSLTQTLQDFDEESKPRETAALARYAIGRDRRGSDIAIHMSQVGRSTILGGSKEVVDAALKAASSGGSVLDSPVLKKPLESVSFCSKIVLVDASAAMRLAVTITGVAPLPAELAPADKPEPGPDTLGALTKAMAGTYLELRTREGTDHVECRIGVYKLPAIGEVFSLFMKLKAQMEQRQRAWSAVTGKLGRLVTVTADDLVVEADTFQMATAVFRLKNDTDLPMVFEGKFHPMISGVVGRPEIKKAVAAHSEERIEILVNTTRPFRVRSGRKRIGYLHGNILYESSTGQVDRIKYVNLNLFIEGDPQKEPAKKAKATAGKSSSAPSISR